MGKNANSSKKQQYATATASETQSTDTAKNLPKF